MKEIESKGKEKGESMEGVQENRRKKEEHIEEHRE